MNTERQIRKGDRFEHARHLDIGSHGAFTATVEQMTEGGFFVRRWLP